jgi:superfamily II DNA or RNA helicase
MTATLLKPRDYQQGAITALHTEWDAGIWRPAVVLPTGGGKTIVFSHLTEAHLAGMYLKFNVGKRVLILSHTDELVLQAADKCRKVAPHRTIGIVKATQNEVHAEVISASVQTLRNAKRREQLKHVGLIIVDEAHHAVAATYRTILEHFGAFETPARVLVAGFTATLVRGDKEKLSDVWQKVAFQKDIAFMIRRGYLLDVRGKRVVVPDLDFSKVRMSGGDFREGDLGDALEESFAPEVVAKAYVEHAGDRKGILFAPTVDSAYAFALAFVAEGISVAVVHGALPREERRQILRDFAAGTVQVVCNCMVLTEGFDEPTADVCVIARPTTNAGLYQQMVGRVLRPDLTIPPTDRQPALILDVVGVSRRHGLQSLVDLSSRKDLPEDLDEDLTLLQLEELELVEPAEGISADGEEYYVGPVDAEDFDPLARDSERSWMKTPGGIYYLGAGTSQYVFLVPSLTGDPGTFDVVWCTKDVRDSARPGTAGLTEHRALSFEMALSWGEEESLERGGLGTKTLTTRKARWRKDPATGPALWKASREAGVKFPLNEAGQALNPDGSIVTKGQVSEIIENALAAKRIDPLVQAVLGGVKS